MFNDSLHKSGKKGNTDIKLFCIRFEVKPFVKKFLFSKPLH